MSNNTDPFWGDNSPLSSLTGFAFVIICSSRLAFALVSAFSLALVYCLTTLVLVLAKKILPEAGRAAGKSVTLFLASFFGIVYLLVIMLINPLLGLECFFPLLLTPLIFSGSRFGLRLAGLYPVDALIAALKEAAVPGLLALCLALIREPLGFASLSLPGGERGIVFLFAAASPPMAIAASGAGALILAGLGIGLYRKIGNMTDKGEESGE
jgi:Na+-transporting NADH:ubiquinone oxidoreductase subunit NqrD